MVGYQELGKHVTATIQNILSAQNRRKRSAGGVRVRWEKSRKIPA
jgi:hypothetical protein